VPTLVKFAYDIKVRGPGIVNFKQMSISGYVGNNCSILLNFVNISTECTNTHVSQCTKSFL